MAVEAVYVFDACAFIALLEDESGSEVVEVLLKDPSNRCVIHAVNACEVYYDLCRRGDLEGAASLDAIFASYGLALLDTMPSTLWRGAGDLKAAWRRVSLADCFALALAIQEKATLVTSDHRELDPIAEAKICPILFIR